MYGENAKMKTRLDFYAREFWLEWEESFHEFAELVLESDADEVVQHSEIIADNLRLVVNRICEEYIAGERETDELIAVAEVQSWFEKL